MDTRSASRSLATWQLSRDLVSQTSSRDSGNRTRWEWTGVGGSGTLSGPEPASSPSSSLPFVSWPGGDPRWRPPSLCFIEFRGSLKRQLSLPSRSPSPKPAGVHEIQSSASSKCHLKSITPGLLAVEIPSNWDAVYNSCAVQCGLGGR
jgi:hypothetical protein